MSYSFVMLKPESSIYVADILADLELNGYKVVDSYNIADYVSFARQIYFIANYKKDPRYYEIISACIKAESLLFGNEALLLEVQNEEELLEHLRHLDKVKSNIRKRISLSKSKAFQAFIDVDRLGIPCNPAVRGMIKVVSDDNTIQEPYKNNIAFGNLVCFYLSYLHTLDPEMDIYSETMAYVSSMKLRKLPEDRLELVKKYKTFHL